MTNLTKPDPENDPIAQLVSSFSIALAEKMHRASEKYGYDHHPWQRPGWADELRTELRKHVEKGDPRDVAAYCAFAWYHGWSLADEPGEVPTPQPTLEVPTKEFPPDYIYELAGTLYLRETAFTDDYLWDHALEISQDPSKHDMHRTTYIILVKGRYYRFSAEFSYNNGRMDRGDYYLTAVVPTPVTTTEWKTVK